LINDTIFKKVKHLKQEIFTKFFFPNQVKLDAGANLDSDSDDSMGPQNNAPTGHMHSDGFTNNTIESTSVTSTSNKNRDIANKLKDMEKILFEKLSNNWVSVRKAFLDLD
jgi:hypothetical protein